MAEIEEEETFLDCGICGKEMPKDIDKSFDETDSNESFTLLQEWLEIYAEKNLFDKVLYICPDCLAKLKALFCRGNKQ